MIKPETKKILEDLGRTNFGQALRELLRQELDKLDTVKGVTSLEEALGREKAVKTIEQVFSFLDGKPGVDKTKNQYQ